MRHGTFERYMKGCLCDKCFQAAGQVHKAREMMITKVVNKGASGKQYLEGPKRFKKKIHGTRGAYVNGCRCEACKAAAMTYQTQRRKSRVAI